ncbi:unnamed protein product [Closterium sp. Naga37s-1]|nr:unnamed protein product [Closterium sp. Naga37s-1]
MQRLIQCNIRECPLLSDRRTRVIYGRGNMEEGEEGEGGMEGAEGFATGEEGDQNDEEDSEDDVEDSEEGEEEEDESDEDEDGDEDEDDDDEDGNEEEDSEDGDGGDESDEDDEGDVGDASSAAAFGSCTFKIASSFSTWRTIVLPRVSNLQAGVVGTKSCSSPISSSSLITSHGLATSASFTPAAAATSATSTPAAVAATSASLTSASPSSSTAAAGAGGAVSTGGVGVAAAGEPGVGNGRIRVKTKALTKQAKHIMNILDAEATGALREQRNMPDFKPGDVLSIKIEVPENKRRTSIVKGIVIARRNAGVGSTFRIRRMLAGVGVEMSFPL